MTAVTAAKASASPQASNAPSLLLQRTCACGGSAGISGECEQCHSKRLLGKPLQTKLRIGEADDEYEREADRVADEVMRMPATPVHPESISAPEVPLVRRHVSRGGASGAQRVPEIVHEVLASPGHPLGSATREFFEPRFGYDLGHVRVHSDAKAARSARAVNALAYTVGSNIVLGAPQILSGGDRHARVMAHELAHVVQQSGVGTRAVAPLLSRTPSDANDSTEQPAKPGLYGLPVGHGAFFIHIGEQVIVYDAGTEGDIEQVKKTSPNVLDAAEKRAGALIERAEVNELGELVPRKHIDELRITHVHRDHINFLRDLRARGFTIGLVELNLFQLEFGGAEAQGVIASLGGQTRLRVLYFDFANNRPAVAEMRVAEINPRSLAERFPLPERYKLTAQSLEMLDNQIPSAIVASLVPMADQELPREQFIAQITERLGGKVDSSTLASILAAAAPAAGGAYQASSYSAFVAPDFSRQLIRARMDPGYNSSAKIDAMSTIYVDESIPGVRVVHGSDPRIGDLARFAENEAFQTALLQKVPPTTLWLLTHHMSRGFFKREGFAKRKEAKEPAPDQVLRFLDSMIIRRLAPAATGKPGRHLISASVHPGEVSVSIPYLLIASGFEVLLAHGETELRAMSSSDITGAPWTGPMPDGEPLLTSYEMFLALQAVKERSAELEDLMRRIADARLEYVRRVLRTLHGAYELEKLEALGRAPQSEELLEAAILDQNAERIEAFVRDLAKQSGEAEADAESSPAEIAKRAASSVIEQAKQLATLVDEAKRFLGVPPGAVNEPEGAPRTQPPGLVPFTPPDLASFYSHYHYPRSFTAPDPMATGLGTVPPAFVRPAARAAPRQLPDYQIFPDEAFERARERVRVRVGPSDPEPATSRHQQPQSKMHPDWEWPSKPPTTTSARPTRRVITDAQPVGSAAGETSTALVPVSAAAHQPVATKAGTQETGLLTGAPAPPQLKGPTTSSGSQPMKLKVSPAGGAAAGAGAALVVEAMANRWAQYVNEREIDKAQKAVEGFWPDLESRLQARSEMSAIVFVAISRHKASDILRFRFADWELSSAATLPEAQTFHVDRGGYAPPESDEIIVINYQWVRITSGGDLELSEIWSETDVGTGWVGEAIETMNQTLHDVWQRVAD